MEKGEELRGLSGTYRVEDKRGTGAFGVAYRAVDVASGEALIVKELHFERLREWKALELFEREARVLSALSHPRIPRFRDFFAIGEDGPVVPRSDAAVPDQRLVLVQQFVEGTSLEERVAANKPLAPRDALYVLESLLRALEYLHDRDVPVLHRDIKPANVVLTPQGEPYLVDFGATQLDATRADGSTIVGTPGYMAPEQLRGAAKPASDLYALGLTLAVAMAGRPLTALHFDDATGNLDVARALPKDTPPALHRVLAHMIAPAIGQRTASARQAREELLSGPSLAPAPRWSSRAKGVAAVVSGSIALVVAAAVVGRALEPPPMVATPSLDRPAATGPARAPIREPPYVPRISYGRTPYVNPIGGFQWGAPGSVEADLLAKGLRWREVGGELATGDYVYDRLQDRLNQPTGRGSVGRVISMAGDPSDRAAQVDFGRGRTAFISIRELVKLAMRQAPDEAAPHSVEGRIAAAGAFWEQNPGPVQVGDYVHDSVASRANSPAGRGRLGFVRSVNESDHGGSAEVDFGTGTTSSLPTADLVRGTVKSAALGF